MFILARGGETYCRLRFRAGPGGAWEIPSDIDFERDFAGSNCDAWAAEYKATVREAQAMFAGKPEAQFGADLSVLAEGADFFDNFWDIFDWERELDLHEYAI